MLKINYFPIIQQSAWWLTYSV